MPIPVPGSMSPMLLTSLSGCFERGSEAIIRVCVELLVMRIESLTAMVMF